MAPKTSVAPLVLSALFGSRSGEAFAPSFTAQDTNMVSTLLPREGGRTVASPKKGGSGGGSGGGMMAVRGRVYNGSAGSHRVRRSALSDVPPPRFYEGPQDIYYQEQEQERKHDHHHDHDHDHQQNLAVASYFAEDESIVSHPAPPGGTVLDGHFVQGDARHSAVPPEPGGGAVGAVGVDRTFQPYDDRSWRRRARDSRRDTVIDNAEEFDAHGAIGNGDHHHCGGDGVMYAIRKRASEKEEVVASRKESQQKAINRAALPLVDLVGVVSPLVLIVGMSIVQNTP